MTREGASQLIHSFIYPFCKYLSSASCAKASAETHRHESGMALVLKKPLI